MKLDALGDRPTARPETASAQPGSRGRVIHSRAVPHVNVLPAKQPRESRQAGRWQRTNDPLGEIDDSVGETHAGVILARRFRLRVRPGHLFLSSSNDPRTPGRASEAGDEIVVSEAEAAQLFRIGRRGLELLEVIDDEPKPKKKLPG